MTTNKIIIIYIFILSFFQLHGNIKNSDNSVITPQSTNLALCLDGNDNNVRTGMGIIENNWTLEAWIKGDDTNWKELEVIIGGGEYSELNTADNLPLVVKKGKLHSNKANLTAPALLDDKWHHVALSCDGQTTSLLLDGVIVDKADTVLAVLPGAIGVNDVDFTFGGMIDEVRVWNAGLPVKTLQAWMNRPIEAEHPFFKNLQGYYNFDDLEDEISVNWVGKGHQAYHIRNGRNNYKGTSPLAYGAVNNNPAFKSYTGKQKLFNAICINSEWDADQGAKDDQVVKLRIAIQGEEKHLSLTKLCLDLSKTTSLSDIEKIHVYYTGQKARSNIKTELFGTGTAPSAQIELSASPETAIKLSPGINYFLVTFDIKDQATIGNTLNAIITSFRLDQTNYIPEYGTDEILKTVTANSLNNPNIVKILQWNIWHGGVHLGNEGQLRVLDLIRSTRADVVMMQEAYGIQKMLADSLGFNMQTHSLTDNLALYSRFPIDSIPLREPFKSNPAKITLANGNKMLLVDCWLRYAYRPEYTSGYANTGLNPNGWIAEDSILALPDIRNIVELDVEPNLDTPNMPIVISGDFNSCSHQDWTERARPLHWGYGPVSFPASRYMVEKGFRDSFREMNPDEVAYQGGTVSAVYGQMQMSRIDFIYYRGGAKAVSSKIIRSAPEIDYVWASDHAAVVTVLEVLPATEIRK